MNEPEKLKDTLTSIFRRKGASGRYTRVFDELGPGEQEFLLRRVHLSSDELPVVGSAESPGTWFLITTERVAWHFSRQDKMLPVQDIWHAKADLPKMVASSTKKNELRELQIQTRDHENVSIEIEQGAPLAGVWNVLLNLAARNH